MLEVMNTTPEAYDFVIFHQPNPKFPTRAMEDWLQSRTMEDGTSRLRDRNTYAGSAMIGLSAVLDEARPGQRILMVSYGSGAAPTRLTCLLPIRSWKRSTAPPPRVITSAAARKLTMRNTCASARNWQHTKLRRSPTNYPTLSHTRVWIMWD